jgi:3-oxoacyl-[acyl-carrier-protein] synthase I
LENKNGFDPMKEIFLIDDAIISPLGFSTGENLEALREERSGLRFQENLRFKTGGYYAGKIDDRKLKTAFSEIGDVSSFTKLEKMMILAIHQILGNNPDIDVSTTGLIISTTKGNIDILKGNSEFPGDRVYLSNLAKIIAGFFGFPQPIVVSNACISGGLAMVVAKRMINAGRFSQAVVVGGDLVSDFVVSGFQSFMALSESTCRPFSKNRDGINLGEAAAAILVSISPGKGKKNITLAGEGSANDANHISGPSRTGEGLFKSIDLALRSAGLESEDIGYISAHGTGTLYNDEMEAIAIHRAGLEKIPLNSLKAYYGHTLGAAALLESIITVHSLMNDELYRSLNYQEHGISKPLNIITCHQDSEINYAMKISSGFGGCNLALIFKKSGYGF